MFERFTPEARQSVVVGQAMAWELWHDHVGTEHLLVGIVRVDPDVPGLIGHTLDSIRERIEATVPGGPSAPKEHLPITPRAKRALELALRHADDLDQHDIGTGHPLFGVLSQPDCTGATVLTRLGADIDAIRRTLADTLRSD